MSLDDLLKRPADPLIGKKLGHVLVDRWMADGTTGTIYFGNHAVSKKEVAIRVLRKEMTERPGFTGKFLQELESAQQLHHPNIVGVVDVGDVGGVVYVAMEFVRGEPLKALVRRQGKLDFERATRIIRDVARGLDAAHSLELIHRDVRPSNILIDMEGNPRINNFGLARPASVGSGRTQIGDFVGPPDFLSPEQVSGEVVDSRSDQYSLGLTYYFMLTGEMPFQGVNDADIARARLKQEVPMVEGLNAHGLQLLERLTARSPKDRFPGMREVVGACERVMYGRDDAQVTARVTGAPMPAPSKPVKPGGTTKRERHGLTVLPTMIWAPALKLGWAYLAYLAAVACVVAGAGMRAAPSSVRIAFLSVALFPLAMFVTLICKQKTGWRGMGASLLAACALGLFFFGFSVIESWHAVVAPINAMALGAAIVLGVAISAVRDFERGAVRRLVLLAGFALLGAGAVQERTAQGLLDWVRQTPLPALGIMAGAALGTFCAIVLLCSPHAGGWVRLAGFVGALLAMAGITLAFRGGEYSGLIEDLRGRIANHGTAASLGIFVAACGHYLLKRPR